MIVYHGSDKKIEKPNYRGSRKGTDFGIGFYCTKNLEMAKSWCALRNGQYVNILLSDYKDSLEAGDLICISRGSLYYLSWIEENSIINEREYSKNEKQYYMEAMEWLGYTLQSWYEDFGITGKDICSKLKKEDFEWLISNWSILHTQDTKYVLEEARTTRKINF